jgi:DNA-binding CsgD family transcriptional regulator
VTELDPSELVGLLEAVYALEVDDATWMDRSLAALRAVCGSEHHYLGFFYDASNVEDFKLWNVGLNNTPPEVLPTFDAFRAIMNPDFVRTTFRSLYFGSSVETAYEHMAPVLEVRAKVGWGDILNINGLDPSGVGCLLTFGSREPHIVLSPPDRALVRRIALHLGSAFRCRRRLAALSADASPVRATTGAEAILDSGGRFTHADGAAESKASREKIRSASAAIDSVRTSNERGQGRRALDAWHPLTSARWTLVDTFEENGRRYVVARENQLQARGLAELTDRERQVVVHAALGFSNKQIAYALGISDATVRVLVARGARRMGVRKRKDLLEHPALRELRSGKGQ